MPSSAGGLYSLVAVNFTVVKVPVSLMVPLASLLPLVPIWPFRVPDTDDPLTVKFLTPLSLSPLRRVTAIGLGRTPLRSVKVSFDAREPISRIGSVTGARNWISYSALGVPETWITSVAGSDGEKVEVGPAKYGQLSSTRLPGVSHTWVPRSRTPTPSRLPCAMFDPTDVQSVAAVATVGAACACAVAPAIRASAVAEPSTSARRRRGTPDLVRAFDAMRTLADPPLPPASS